MKGGIKKRPDVIEVQDLAAERLESTGVIRSLGSAHDPTRFAALRRLRAFLEGRSRMAAADMAKLWRGIFYAFWHADGVAYQTHLADELSGIVEGLQEQVAPLYVAGLFSTMRREWIGIDYLRLDKFLMLVRKFLSSTFRRIHASGWCSTHCRCLMDVLENEIFLPQSGPSAAGLAYHVADLYVEELCKVVDGSCHKLPCWSGIKLLLQPFINCILKTSNEALVKRVRSTVFHELHQSSSHLAFANMQPLRMKRLFLDAVLEAATEVGRTAAIELAEEIGELSVAVHDGDMGHDHCVEVGSEHACATKAAATSEEGGSSTGVHDGGSCSVSVPASTDAKSDGSKVGRKKRKNVAAMEALLSLDEPLNQQLTSKKRKKMKKQMMADALVAVEASERRKTQAQVNGASDRLGEELGLQTSDEAGFQKNERKRKRKKPDGGASETLKGVPNPTAEQPSSATARKQPKNGQEMGGTCNGAASSNGTVKAPKDVTAARAWIEDTASDEGGVEGKGAKALQQQGARTGNNNHCVELPRDRGRKKKAKRGNRQATMAEQAMAWLSQMRMALTGPDPETKERVENANKQWVEFYSNSNGSNGNGAEHTPQKGKPHRVKFALGKNVVAGMDKPLPPKTLTNPPETSPKGPILRRH
ncbi:unnamed protein product [Ostreobium quekettii]|uniref:Nucleolar protein,Nop52-domain-containing protein n=1 Tax=Ostreobium quekettii TaxID=121088 RepID=A0A8S1IXB9_9CHLO|nr:unnamed protein product [Ostreobium quekettii]|eukprot:evm.model.scf_750.2 EVM.evm.TU.scf_750.2   scf_750:18951-23697(-)